MRGTPYFTTLAPIHLESHSFENGGEARIRSLSCTTTVSEGSEQALYCTEEEKRRANHLSGVRMVQMTTSGAWQGGWMVRGAGIDIVLDVPRFRSLVIL